MWTLFEPVHAVTYFAPQARSAFEAAGLRGFWRGYFAGRAAPLGPAGAAVVTASFYNFAPAFVARAVPGVWELITPEEALRTRLAGATAALGGLLAGRESEVAAAADLLGLAVAGLDCAGRVLAAANAALPVPDDGLARLWQAATLLREHRGDGHFAALAAADIDGCEAVVLRSGLDLRRENLQPVRGWTDEAVGSRARPAGRPRVDRRQRGAHARGAGGARGRGGRDRPRGGAALGSPRTGPGGGGREGPRPARAGVRGDPSLSEPHRRARSRRGRLRRPAP